MNISRLNRRQTAWLLAGAALLCASQGFAASEQQLAIAMTDKAAHLAHPTNPKLIGKAMLDVPDPDGKLFRKERVELAGGKGKGWVDYKYKNPVSNKIEQKSAYVLKVDDVIISVGVYRD